MCKPAETSTSGGDKLASSSTVARSRSLDFLCFFVPALFCTVTNVLPIYLTGLLRILSTHVFMSLHYMYVDKDNYENKIAQKQIMREKGDYLVGIILHMWAQLALQLMFPGMFFVDNALMGPSTWHTLLAHVAVVEPLYYVVHRWLHVPKHMKAMHGFHHASINTVPSTSLVQNFHEHFIYIATFGPAMLLPYFLAGYQHWVTVMGYLVMFDIVNALGHTNIRLSQHWLFSHKFSPVKYLFYTPEFHLGHHAYFNYNFGLFMPLWDHLFGTYREYRKPASKLLPANQQDFVFIGHNGGLGHALTVPEYSIYNVYDAYRFSGLPIEVEMYFMNFLVILWRLVARRYVVSRYLAQGKFIGRIICIMRSPIDYSRPAHYPAINREILALIKEEHQTKGTRFFGLGNLNKMKQLNDGGKLVSELIRSDPYLSDKKVRLWTGDTMTAASVYHQLLALTPDLKEVLYIGANGKIGQAVCQLLVSKGIKIRVYSSYEGGLTPHPLISYTQDLGEMRRFKYVVVGKYVNRKLYRKALSGGPLDPEVDRIRVLDYTVPFLPIGNIHAKAGKGSSNNDSGSKQNSSNSADRSSISVSSISSSKSQSSIVQHIQIGVLQVKNNEFLKGYYDICMGTDQNQIYPCHLGCIVNMLQGKEDDEVGDIDVDRIEGLWKAALEFGVDNRPIDLSAK